ncbi:MAG: metabolite traffic protein EboE, partial [Verrucomicrobiota bacterium]
MNPSRYPQLHLAYCQNIHPGETWHEHLGALQEKATGVRTALNSAGLLPYGAPFGLGLRLSAHAAAELQAEPNLNQGRVLFESETLYPFSINGFPYGKFHRGPVKQNVYAPDWRSTERLEYTVNLANALAAWLPRGSAGSISTVPGSYAAWIHNKEAESEMAKMLGTAVCHLARLERETDRLIHLGLEPEPDCFLETTAQTIAFFQGTLPEGALPVIKKTLGTSLEQAEALLRRHLGVCFDTCHVALQFEDPATALCAYRDAGILISKIQISAALRTKATPDACKALAQFQEPTYLHQVKALRTNGTLATWPDLPNAIEALSLPAALNALEELRVHFHVPLFVSPKAPLASTANTLEDAFWSEVRSGIP